MNCVKCLRKMTNYLRDQSKFGCNYRIFFLRISSISVLRKLIFCKRRSWMPTTTYAIRPSSSVIRLIPLQLRCSHRPSNNPILRCPHSDRLCLSPSLLPFQHSRLQHSWQMVSQIRSYWIDYISWKFVSSKVKKGKRKNANIFLVIKEELSSLFPIFYEFFPTHLSYQALWRANC